MCFCKANNMDSYYELQVYAYDHDHDELKDWITYAEKRDCISYSAIILKKITSKNRKVVELCLNSMVMRAFSLKGNYQIFGE